MPKMLYVLNDSPSSRNVPILKVGRMTIRPGELKTFPLSQVNRQNEHFLDRSFQDEKGNALKCFRYGFYDTEVINHHEIKEALDNNLPIKDYLRSRTDNRSNYEILRSLEVIDVRTLSTDDVPQLRMIAAALGHNVASIEDRQELTNLITHSMTEWSNKDVKHRKLYSDDEIEILLNGSSEPESTEDEVEITGDESDDDGDSAAHESDESDSSATTDSSD